MSLSLGFLRLVSSSCSFAERRANWAVIQRWPVTAGVCAALALGILSPCFAQSKTATGTTLSITEGTSPATTVAAGTVVTLTATVTAGAGPVPPGLVKFCDATAAYCQDIHIVGTAQLTSAGTAAIKVRPGIGSHSYKAVFVGTTGCAGSSSGVAALAVTGAIPPLASAATISQTGNWGAYTLSATVTETGNTAPPTGTVSFLDTNNGNAVLGTGTLGSATRRVAWTNVNTSAPNLAGVYYAVADLNGDGIPDLFVQDYFGTYDVFLGNGDGSFTEKGSAFGPSSETGAFILGDFNNDGIPDVAAIDASSYAPNNTITIFLGNGDGTFTVAGSSPAIGYNPTAIATADVNGDGNADLIVVQQGSSTSSGGQVVIFFGNGDGTFTQASSTTSLASIAGSILPADLNSDGHVDLVAGGLGSSGVAILLGKGDGTFTSAASISQAGEATPVVADVNNDGFPDLVFGAANTSYLTVFLGNGDGTFTEAATNPNGKLVIGNSLAIADFNQDGIPDVAYTNGNTTGILFGNGDGTFVQFPAALTFDTYGFGTAFVAADFNGDGWPDVLAIDGSGRTIADSLTQPTETATASATVSMAAAGPHLVDTSYPGDSNYDASISGTVSLWGAPPTTTTTLTMTSAGAQVTSVTSGSVVTLTATVVAGASPVTTGEVNFCDASATLCSDIRLLGTVHLSSSGTATFKFVPGPGTHSYKAMFVEDGYGLTSSSPVTTLTVGAQPVVYSDVAGITTSGFPGDYSLTATVVGYGGPTAPTGSVSFLDTSYGNTSLATAPLGPSTVGRGWLMSETPTLSNAPTSEVAGDFNGDGIPDVAVLSASSLYGGPYYVTVFFGAGNGTFTASPTVQVTGVQESPTMIGGDFNGDGKVDLAVLSYNGYSTSYVTTLLGNGDGTFGTAQTGVAYNQGPVGGDVVPGSMVAADFNGDGKMDLAIVGDYVSSGGVTILLGNGDGTFTAAGPNLDVSGDFGLIATGDFNGDGIPDLVATNYFDFGTSPTIFLGKGDGTFTSMGTSFTLDYFPTSVVVADFNDDGALDLAFSDLNGVEIALGNGDGTFKETAGSPISVPSELHNLVAGDFNNDGKLDLAGTGGTSSQIELLIGAGDGTFTATSTTAVTSQSSSNATAMVAADFNEDGVPDLAILSQNLDAASIFLNEPTQTATATVNGIAPIGAGTHNVEASYSGDGTYSSTVSGTTALTAGMAPIVFSPAAGTYSTVQTVTLSEPIPGATIYYSASGVVNTNGFVAYTAPIQLTEGGVESIEAYATESGYQQSNPATANYTMNLPAAPTPVISLASGEYPSAQTVTITDSAPGATIFYSTNGLPPTQNSTVYTGPITISSSEVLSAIAVGGGYSASNAATAQYLIASSSVPLIYTIAGNESWGFAGDGGPATVASLNEPFATAVDSAGNLYIADSTNNVVRKVAANTGIISTYAGSQTWGYSGDGGPAASAQLDYPTGLAVDSAGNLYICDEGNNVVREVAAATGTITTVAGNATATALGDGGPATSAEVLQPTGVAVDAAGNLYIATAAMSRVRKVTASTGIITTVAGNGALGYAGDGGLATNATLFFPEGVAVDGAGNLYIADTDNSVVRKVTASTGMITTVAGQKRQISTPPYLFGGDGGAATSAFLNVPYAVAVDNSGNLYIADTDNFAIREVTASNGVINTIAGTPSSTCQTVSGDGGPANNAGVCAPSGVTVDSAGNLYIAEPSANRIRKVTAPALPPTTSTAVPVFSVTAGTYAGPQMVSITDATPGAEIYVTTNGSVPSPAQPGYHGAINVTGTATLNAIAVAPGYLASSVSTQAYTITAPPAAVISTVAGTGVSGLSGSGGAATSQELSYPNGVAVDGAGNLYIADTDNEVVWEVAARTGNISIVAGTLGVPGAVQSGVPATSAPLRGPTHVALDNSGNLYISDTGNNVVRMVSARTGMISTFAGTSGTAIGSPYGDGGAATSASLNAPQGIAFDSAGNLSIADEGHNSIRMVAAATGLISTVAGNYAQSAGLGDGGLATSAHLYYPLGVAFDGNNNLYIADTYDGRVRLVSAGTGIITTVAGIGNRGNSGDGGPATSAEVDPLDVKVDSAGNLYIANWPNAVRMLPAASTTISTIAGNGFTGYSGDGGSATMAGLCEPANLAFDPSGSLYIADNCNNRVRKVTFSGLAATPTFSLAAGTYVNAQVVKITDSTPGATIYYTTDGSVPSAGSLVYTGPITISSSETLKAIAVATGFPGSAVASAAYVILAPVTITWTAPAAVTYGTPLSGTQLNASASVAGTITYSPPAGSILSAGVQTLTATFTPSDSTVYSTATASVSITVNQATPAVTWATPAAIPLGAALGSAQLDATATVPGSFAYNPAAGAVLPLGNNTLAVAFTPSDATDYTSASAKVTLAVVQPMPAAGSLSPAVETAGGAAFTLTVNGSGFTTASVVYWGAAALTTQYISGTQLTAQVPAANIAAAGVDSVSVQNPTPGGGTSNTLQFEVDSGTSGSGPTFTTVTATIAPGAAASYPVTLPASATNVSVTCLNLPVGASCSYSSSSSAVSIATTSATPAGTYQITIVFSETLPGAATALLLVPVFLLPFASIRKKPRAQHLWCFLILSVALAATATGCSGGGSSSTTPQTHQVTSSGTVRLIVQ